MGKCPTVPRLCAEAHPVQFWPRLLFLCNILSQCNIRSARMPFRSGTTGLFLLHTLARFEGPAAGAVPWALPAPQASFFCAIFCEVSTSSPPDLPGSGSDLEPRVFFYCTLLHDLRNLRNRDGALGIPRFADILFFVPHFATIQHQARPICPDASLIWGRIPFRVSRMS